VSPHPPIHQVVTVAATPEQAFLAFTEDINGWWPLAHMNVLGEASLLAFADGTLSEGTMDGREAVWGEVQEWEPGRVLALSWHPSVEPTPATQLTVTFTPTAPDGGAGAEGGTTVALQHADWEALADPFASHAEYAAAWPVVLSLYAKYVGEPDEIIAPPAETWVALMHTPGPSAPQDVPVFADPRFAEHVAFLQRMSERGYLVAAGPLSDADGDGMTILRVPGEDGFAAAVELATIDDGAVASGLLAVSVRPWDVMFHSLD
jgi:uncharacterized protein YciI/uncharacterized protein YndB with AHSA1/START domain